MKCESCQKEHIGTYGSGRFCCTKCARGYATSKCRDEINKKVSAKLRGTGQGIEKITCLYCKKEHTAYKRFNRKFCSKSCSRKYYGNSPETREKLRQIMLKKVKNGTHSGWKSRKGKSPSYPEKFFIKVLENNEIKFERDLLVGKWFIDFAIEDKMIALEVDGKQHEYSDRKKSDMVKDKFLVDNGWKVYRIKWKSINNASGKLYINEEINKFLDFYRNVA